MEVRRQSGGTVERNDYGPRVRHLLGNNATRDENIVNATHARATPPVLPSVATYPSLSTVDRAVWVPPVIRCVRHAAVSTCVDRLISFQPGVLDGPKTGADHGDMAA